MKHHIAELLIAAITFAFSINSNAQLSQLIHLKTFSSGYGGQLFQLEEDSVYLLHYRYSEQNFDASIWQNDPEEMISPELATTMLMYDYNFQYIGKIETAASASLHQPLKKSGDNWFFNSSILSGSGLNIFESIPDLTGDYPNTIYGNAAVLRYNQVSQELAMPFYCECYGTDNFDSNKPLPKFQFSADAEGQKFINRFMSAYMGDGTIITTKYLFNQIELNWEETIAIDNGLWGSVWLKINPLSGDYIATPLYSNSGSALSHALFPSDDGNSVYRTGVVYGNNVPISPDGSLWQTNDEDTLFHAFIVKENSVGEQEWIEPLYAYNNNFIDDGDQVGYNLNANMESLSLVELDGDVFLSHSARLLAGEGDSLIFQDFNGETGIYSNEVAGNPNDHYGHATHNIFKFSQEGERLAWLKYQLPESEYNNILNSSDLQYPYLFKVQDKLAWVQKYFSANDTTIQVFKSETGGNIDTIDINLPAGQGVYLSWFDSNLNLLDVLNIPYEGPFFPGVSIYNVSLYHEDTLIISGDIFSGVTTTLDPEGNSSPVTYNQTKTFIGFYTLPSIFTGVDNFEANNKIKLSIFPNPAKETINLRTNYTQKAKYIIFDISGRILKTGFIASGAGIKTIDIQNLNAGIYILSLSLDDQILNEKFVVN